MQQILQQLQALAQNSLVPLIVIILGLFLAWVAARIIAFLVRRVLERAQVDERASKSLGTQTQITRWVSGLTFWVVFIVVLEQLAVGAAKYAGANTAVVYGPLNDLINTWFPRLVTVGVFLFVAWVVAAVLKFLVVNVLNMTRLAERLGEQVGGKKTAAATTNESIGTAVFWLTFLVFTPAILTSLGLSQPADSLQSLVNTMLGYVFGIVGAVVILILGALLARIVRQIVSGFLQGVGADSLGERVGLSKAQNAQPLSMLAGTVVYVFVMTYVIGLALSTLNLPALSTISAQVLGSVTGVMLTVLGAAVILGVAYYVAKFVSEVAASLLTGIGVNKLPGALGFKTAKNADLSGVIGYVVLVAVMLLAVQGTAQFIGLSTIADLVGKLIGFFGQVMLGIVIFLAGIYLANVASRVIGSTGGSDATLLANVARWAILIFVASVALTQAGVPLAGDVLTIILWTIGAAAALAFGLGGRDAAGKQLEKWFNRKPTK